MRTGEGIDIIIMNNSDNYHNNFDYLLGCPVRCSGKQKLKSPVKLLIQHSEF